MFHMDQMAGWLQPACRMEFSHCCFRMGRPLLPIWISSPSGPKLIKSTQNRPKSPKVNMLKFGMSVLILVSNGAFQRSNRICSQDWHADLGHISLGQQPILATMSWNVRNIVRHVRNVRNVPGPWEHCSGTTQALGINS